VNTVKINELLTINMDNVAYAEDYDQYPPGMTLDEAAKEGHIWPVTMVVFNTAPVGEYGALKIDLAHDERDVFLKHFRNGNAS